MPPKELALSKSPTNARTAGTTPPTPDDASARVPYEPLGKLFLPFLKFGSLAWGGPVAQIAMIRQKLVIEEKWVRPQHFNRVLAMYQVLRGPEAVVSRASAVFHYQLLCRCARSALTSNRK